MNDFNKILPELLNLQKIVQELDHKVSSLIASGGNVEAPEQKLNIFITRTTKIRFPFDFRFEGPVNLTRSVSTSRAVILLVLLLDFQDRSEGFSGIEDIQLKIVDAYHLIDNGEKEIENKVSAAFYRVETEFLKELNAVMKSGTFTLKNGRLGFNLNSKVWQPMQIEVIVEDVEIAEICNRILPTSPLSRAQRRKALFVAGGPDGFDRLFYDLFNHDHLLKETSMFFKPSIITYPLHLLEFIGASKQDIARRELALKGLQSGKFHFLEILNRTTLQQMVLFDLTSNKFSMYPPNVVQKHIDDHFYSIMEMVKKYETYELVLTDAPLPFLLSTFEIIGDSKHECYTIFFQQLIKEHDPDVNCFTINDKEVMTQVISNLVGWILRHPTTERNKDKVFLELKEALAQA